ncbi:MAG: DUF2007 domain-containing protein [Rhodospirillaceae bacterium]|nr:DUF2007 domain-containing protein [Rhodospirillaceae bacterium]
MRELLRTNDPVRLSWLTALLTDQQIEAFVLDTHRGRTGRSADG